MLFVLNEDDVTDEQSSSQQSTSTRSLQQKDHLRYFRAHVNQRLAQVDHVYFDRYAKTATNGRVVLTSKGLRSGQHSWSIKILKCDVELQELGVISNVNIHGVDVADGGLRESVAFGAKGLYGNEMGTVCAFLVCFYFVRLSILFYGITHRVWRLESPFYSASNDAPDVGQLLNLCD